MCTIVDLFACHRNRCKPNSQHLMCCCYLCTAATRNRLKERWVRKITEKKQQQHTLNSNPICCYVGGCGYRAGFISIFLFVGCSMYDYYCVCVFRKWSFHCTPPIAPTVMHLLNFVSVSVFFLLLSALFSLPPFFLFLVLFLTFLLSFFFALTLALSLSPFLQFFLRLFSFFFFCFSIFNSVRHTHTHRKIYSRNEIAISFKNWTCFSSTLVFSRSAVVVWCCVVIYHCCQCADDWMYFVFHSSPFDRVWFGCIRIYSYILYTGVFFLRFILSLSLIR